MRDASGIVNQDIVGYFWSSIQGSASDRGIVLRFQNNGSNPNHDIHSKVVGTTIRCVR